MGRYYNGDIEGKFWFGMQDSYDISAIMGEYGEDSISTACAIWYDRQVEQAAIIIKDWINA